MLPGWYGFGTAVDAWLAATSATASPLLREMHARWPFFRSVLSNMAMVLAKTDLAIASRYAELVPDARAARRASSARIAAEHARTVAHVPRDHRQPTLARRQPDARRAASATASRTSIRSTTCRSSCCAATAAATTDERTRRAIHLTINGLAAGLAQQRLAIISLLRPCGRPRCSIIVLPRAMCVGRAQSRGDAGLRPYGFARPAHAHPALQRRRLFRARARAPRRGARAARRDHGRRAGARPQRRVELADARPAADGAARAQRLPVRQRHADRLRASRGDRTARPLARHGDLGHQPRRQHGRRHDLLGHRRRRDRGLPARHSVDRDLARVEDRARISRPPPRSRSSWSSGTARHRAGRVAAQRQRARHAARGDPRLSRSRASAAATRRRT